MSETTTLTTSSTTSQEVRPAQEAQPLREHVVTPAVSVYESGDELLIHADMPGVGPDNLVLEVAGRRLWFEGRRMLGRSMVVYRRAFELPYAIDVDGIQAELKYGVLMIHLPKAPHARRRRIMVSAG